MVIDESERRHIRTFWVNPKAQILACGIGSFGFFALAALQIYVLMHIEAHIEMLHAAESIDTQTRLQLSRAVFLSLRLSIVFSVLMGLLGFIVGAWQGHRVFGPLVPIRAHVERLISGNHASRVKLRPSDEMQDLADDLNRLAETLERRR